MSNPMGGPPNAFGPPMPVAQPMTRVPFNNGPAMFIGIGVAMFCGCVPGGVLAILFAHQAKQAADRGNLPEAESKLKLSYITSAASAGLLLVGFCLYAAVMVLASAA